MRHDPGVHGFDMYVLFYLIAMNPKQDYIRVRDEPDCNDMGGSGYHGGR